MAQTKATDIPVALYARHRRTAPRPGPRPAPRAPETTEATPALSTTQPSAYGRFWKRAKDIGFTLFVAPIVLPLIATFALAVFLQDRQNPFYSQPRVGKNGRSFRLWKLRSMVKDAETALDAHFRQNPEARAEWDRHQKLRRDPRVTPIGGFMRKTSIDELPQFFNVLIGDMSVVGPRPMMLEQRALYPCTTYYKMRPGLTGFWQISSRSRSSFADRARFDRLYHGRMSLGADVAVIWRTIKVVLRATGA